MDVEALERLNALPKTIVSLDMDLGRLKRMPEYVRFFLSILRILHLYVQRCFALISSQSL